LVGRHHARRVRGRLGAAIRVGAAVLALGAGAALVAAPPARAADSSFDAVASAYGINNGISNPSFPLNLVLTGSGPVSSAHLTSLGGSDAFASFPYPGDTLVGLPGLASGLFGFSFPSYPLYVATSAGDDPRSANYPGITLSSRSDALVSESRALVGTDVSGFDSASRVAVDGDSGVTSLGQTDFKTLQFGDVFTLSGVRSLAKVVADGTSGALTRSSELSIGAITVPGLQIVIPKQTPGTVPLPIPVPGLGQVPPLTFPPMPIPDGGQTLNAPELGFTDGAFTATLPGQASGQRYVIPTAPVLKAFADHGMTVTFQQAADTKHGVVAPAITFATDFPAPPGNPYYNGVTHATYTLGGAFAEVSFDVVPADTGLTGPPAANASSGAPTQEIDAAAIPGASAPGLLPSTTPAALGLTPRQVAFTPVERANFVALRAPAVVADTQDLYLVVMAIGIAVLVTGTALRRLGVLRPWM
jgi:hypothetical protein